MSTYLLLRDNKQSGPYSLDEITTKGFKKYDLVWVEGRSAAWRYPGEIEELKPYAPIIEEQPFDRFFKKPSQEKKEPKAEQVLSESTKQETANRAAANQIVVEVGSKKVYTTIPARNYNTTQQTEINIAKPSANEVTKNTAKEPYNTTAYNNPDNYASKQEHEPSVQSDPKKKSINDSRFAYRRYLQPGILAVCVIALLGAGIFIGISIGKNSSATVPNLGNENNEMAKRNNQDPSNNSIPVSTSIPVTDNHSSLSIRDNQSLTDMNNSTDTKAGETKPLPTNENKKSDKRKNTGITDAPKITPKETIIPDSSISGSFASRKSAHRTDIINDKDFVKRNINELVSVSANNYDVGTFGGISELQLTLNNRSIYPLDLVMVEVQYVQANKKVYKTENLYYHNVRPGESIMQEAPRSPRGVKVNYKVALINSKEPSVSYSGI
ncbi:MAG TPA: hypothetical protein VMT76_16815 [Puia sp.]|nr:hypothetical protein [Puia sp.]